MRATGPRGKRMDTLNRQNEALPYTVEASATGFLPRQVNGKRRIRSPAQLRKSQWTPPPWHARERPSNP